MTVDEFRKLIGRVTGRIAGQRLDSQLETYLNTHLAGDTPLFMQIEDACHEAIREGWMCNREAGGIAYGRVLKPERAIQGFSVDVVRMADVEGPLHRHPLGEIDMIMPVTEGALFDGKPRGWCVYGPGSTHSPTVTEGEALVLYLLPEGRIEFTR
ncbi:MAG: DUF4863 family protein [Alphaproteobacteria bacterium]